MKKALLILFSLSWAVFLSAQQLSPELVCSSGESFNNTSYQLDWSLGECVITTHSEGTYVITQGFHQGSYEITAIYDLPYAGVNIKVYPNPTTDFITINVGDLTDFEKLSSLTVTDINGKVLFHEKITKVEQQLDFSSFKYGVYFLSLKQENQLIKSFKIIKIQ